MNCWKCGEPTEHGAAECSACESGFKFKFLDEDEDAEKIELLQIDWDKITSLEDMKLVLREIGINDYVVKGTETARALQRFLKPESREEE